MCKQITPGKSRTNYAVSFNLKIKWKVKEVVKTENTPKQNTIFIH